MGRGSKVAAKVGLLSPFCFRRTAATPFFGSESIYGAYTHTHTQSFRNTEAILSFLFCKDLLDPIIVTETTMQQLIAFLNNLHLSIS